MAATVRLIDPIIRVKNVSRSADWYRRMLGLKVEMAVPDKKKPAFVRLNTGEPRGLALMISDGSDPITGRKAPKATVDAIAARKAQRVVSFYVTVNQDVDALFRSLKRRKVKVVSPPQEMPYGMREFHVRDPDGYDVGIGKELRTSRRPAQRRATARRRAGTRPRRGRR